MNWIDIVFVVVLVFGVIFGLRIGLIGAAVIAVALLIGWYLTGLISPGVGDLFEGAPRVKTIITTLLYVLLMAIALAIAENVASWVKRLSSVASLGLSSLLDRLGGAVLGLIIGFILASALLLALVRATYDTGTPGEGVTGAAVARITSVVETRTSIENSVADSAVAPTVIMVYTHLPGNALGFVPDEFMVSLETLEDRIEAR